MGDRLLMQVIDSRTPEQGRHGDDTFGPVIYCHWSGSRAGDICAALRERMKNSPHDLSYTTARAAQIAMVDDTNALSFGVWNATAQLTENDSHGDAGVVLIDCGRNPLSFECLGGYLRVGHDGLPTTTSEE